MAASPHPTAGIAVALLAAGAVAQDRTPLDPPTVAIDPDDVLIDVGELHGRLLDVDGDNVVLELVEVPGSRVAVQREVVPDDALFLYRKARFDPGDRTAWLDLAQLAAAHDLHVRRIESLRAAAALPGPGADAVRARLERARAECAAARLADARALRDDGELAAAIDSLERTVDGFGDCAAGDQAAELLGQLRAQRAAEQRRADTIRERRRTQRQASAELTEVAGLVDRAGRDLRRALGELDESVAAEDLLSDALARYRLARRRLDGLAAEFDPADRSESVRAEARRLDRIVDDGLVRTHVELGYLFIGRGDRQSALRHAGRAALLGPRSVRVDRLRQAIAASGRR